jgi:hypothetical protein
LVLFERGEAELGRGLNSEQVWRYEMKLLETDVLDDGQQEQYGQVLQWERLSSGGQ